MLQLFKRLLGLVRRAPKAPLVRGGERPETGGKAPATPSEPTSVAKPARERTQAPRAAPRPEPAPLPQEPAPNPASLTPSPDRATTDALLAAEANRTPPGRGPRSAMMELLDGKGHLKRGLTGREERILHEVGHRVDEGKLVLPHLPATSLTAMDMAARPSANLTDIVQLIAGDPVLSSELLKIANSAMYAGREECETLREAIMRIGTRTLRSLILSVSMRTVMMRDKNLSEVAHVIWRQAHSVGVICRAIAGHLGFDSERAFVLGLLHDIGKVALLDTVRVCAKNDIVSPALLGRAFYFHHERAGGEIARAWKLPEEIASVAGCHHAFEKNEEHGRAAAMVSFAHAVDLQLSTVGSFDPDERLGHRELDYFGISEENRYAIYSLAEDAFEAGPRSPDEGAEAEAQDGLVLDGSEAA